MPLFYICEQMNIRPIPIQHRVVHMVEYFNKTFILTTLYMFVKADKLNVIGPKTLEQVFLIIGFLGGMIFFLIPGE